MNVAEPRMAKLKLGRIVTGPHASTRLTSEDINTAIQRHQAGDWGDVTETARALNERALKKGFWLLSVYHSATGTKFFVRTEADRSLTMILLPEDH